MNFDHGQRKGDKGRALRREIFLAIDSPNPKEYMHRLLSLIRRGIITFYVAKTSDVFPPLVVDMLYGKKKSDEPNGEGLFVKHLLPVVRTISRLYELSDIRLKGSFG